MISPSGQVHWQPNATCDDLWSVWKWVSHWHVGKTTKRNSHTHFQYLPQYFPTCPSFKPVPLKKKPGINHRRVEEVATVGSIVLRSDTSQDLARRTICIGGGNLCSRHVQKKNYRGFHTWGYPWLSSISRWDFPWHRPSSYWGTPIDGKPPDVDWCL